MLDMESQADFDRIVADAAPLPLKDAAYALWRRRYRLQTLEGRPRPEEVRAFRAMTPTEQAASMRRDRDFAQDGPAFGWLKASHPRAADSDIKQAIIAAVKFESACFKYFEQDNIGDYWDCCVRAVAKAARENPGFLDDTHRAAENDVAYYYK